MKVPGLLLALVVGMPAPALAQAAIIGTVTDSSGASLPGVTVEASSPALIEKTRVATTDRHGQYRIEDLRPGVYAVRFMLQGWTPRQREGIELSGSFTASVDVQMAVGPLTSVTTVIGQLPLIDVANARHELALNAELVRALPTARSYNALLTLVPGVVTSSNDTVTGTATVSFPLHGGRTNEGRLALDGFTIGSPPGGNSATSYTIDVGTTTDVTFSAGGGLGESEVGGLTMNVIPKSGGNTTHGSFFAGATGRRLQFDNLTPELRSQGATTPSRLSNVYDLSGTFGGPLRRDRAWYFLNAHTGGSRREVPNVYYNLNAGDASKWLYAPDLASHEYSDRTFENASGRLTWQASPRNKITGFWDAQALCRTCSGATAGLAEPQVISPEAVGVLGRNLNVTQATWSSPATSRLLLDAGYTGTFFGVGNFEREPNPTRSLIRVAEQCASGCAANGSIPGLVYRSQDFSVAHVGSYLLKGAAAYVTGTNHLKVGYQHTFMTDDRTWLTNDQNLTYRFNNGVPNQLTQSISPWVNNARVAWDAVFVQEEWRRDRLTVQGALRFDRATSWFPAQHEGPARFLTKPIAFPETRGIDSYKDLTPRFGAAIDVFGDGRTALKVNLGRYLEGAGVTGNYANANPSLRMPQTTMTFGTPGVTRSWIDANANMVPDCDLLNPGAQDLRSAGGDLCGVMSNTDFGRNLLSNNFDPAVLNGWGIRPSDWDLGVSLERQIGRGSVTAAYNRRAFYGVSVVDNLAVTAADFTPFSIVAPSDPRLPGGGGYVVSGLYDVVPDKAGMVSNYITGATRYGRWTQYFNGIDLVANIRTLAGLTLAGGTSTGQTVADNCAVRDALPELSTSVTGTTPFGSGLGASAVTPVSPYCHVAYGVLTQGRGLGSYVIPKIAVQVSGAFQSKPGAMLAANYMVPNAVVAPRLGRSLSGDAPNVTVNLIAPGTLYGDRINQLDLRVEKTLTVNHTHTKFAVEVYNALNSSAVLTYNSAYVPSGTWLQPQSILTPRFLKLTAEIIF